MFYQKGENLVNIANSILKAYGLKTYHETYQPLDELLKKNGVPNRKFCLILLDGFGSSIQYIHRHYAPFIYEHRLFKITSVFPPTTVAATTSLLTGKYPMETGWMGWTEKFPMFSRPITVFPSTFIGSANVSAPTSWELLPTLQLDQLINAKGKYKAEKIMGFTLQPPTAKNHFLQTALRLKDVDFLYSYWTDPDATLHEFGVHSAEVENVVHELDEEVKKLTQMYPDVLFITLADHGHIDVQYLPIADHPDFMDCLSFKDFGMEARAASFYVKKGREKEFRSLAEKYYGDKFYIFSNEEIVSKQLFGEGIENQYYRYIAGDFLLVAKDKWTLYQPTAAYLKANHAGSTSQERYINLAVYNSK